jgi:hypothetical protein
MGHLGSPKEEWGVGLIAEAPVPATLCERPNVFESLCRLLFVGKHLKKALLIASGPRKVA